MPQKVVVDTNAFIKHALELTGMAMTRDLLTTPGVLAEIKDKETRNAVALRFPNLQTEKPRKEFTDRVANFALATGDNVSLSPVDVEVIALACQIIEECGQTHFLRKEPAKGKTAVGGVVVEPQAPAEGDMEVEEEEEKTPMKGKEGRPNGFGLAGWGNFGSDDEDGWVGKEQMKQAKTETEAQETVSPVDCAVITEDFAMQNIILQMGIPLLDIDGKRITKLKSYVLECVSCWTVSRQTDIVFCKKCGKNTLLKVTCEFRDDGSFTMFKKKHRQPVVRGNRFPIPEPKGGRGMNDMILYEDDFLKPKVQRFLRIEEHKAKKEGEMFERNVDFGADFGGNRSQRSKMRALQVGGPRRNPNIVRKK